MHTEANLELISRSSDPHDFVECAKQLRLSPNKDQAKRFVDSYVKEVERRGQGMWEIHEELYHILREIPDVIKYGEVQFSDLPKAVLSDPACIQPMVQYPLWMPRALYIEETLYTILDVPDRTLVFWTEGVYTGNIFTCSGYIIPGGEVVGVHPWGEQEICILDSTGNAIHTFEASDFDYSADALSELEIYFIRDDREGLVKLLNSEENGSLKINFSPSDGRPGRIRVTTGYWRARPIGHAYSITVDAIAGEKLYAGTGQNMNAIQVSLNPNL